MIQKVKISRIEPYWNNPRKHKASIEEIIQSIEDYGFNQPIIVDKNMVIIAGHARYKAMQHLGHEEVPVVVADLSEQKAREFRIIDNKTAEMSGWDYAKLINEITAIGDPDFHRTYFPELAIDDLKNITPQDEEVDYSQMEEDDESVIMCPFCDHLFKYKTDEDES